MRVGRLEGGTDKGDFFAEHFHDLKTECGVLPQEIEDGLARNKGKFGILHYFGAQTVGVAGYGGRKAHEEAGRHDSRGEGRIIAVDGKTDFSATNEIQTGGGFATAEKDRTLGLVDDRGQAFEVLCELQGRNQICTVNHLTLSNK